MFDPKLANAKNVARRRFEARGFLDREKSRPCEDCGHKYHPCQMDFLRTDHGRTVPMARMLHLSINRIREEIGKSNLVCANCSRLRVHTRSRLRRGGPT